MPDSIHTRIAERVVRNRGTAWYLGGHEPAHAGGRHSAEHVPALDYDEQSRARARAELGDNLRSLRYQRAGTRGPALPPHLYVPLHAADGLQ